MKPPLTFLVLLYFLQAAYAQPLESTDIPAAVTDKFTLVYPDAKNTSWYQMDSRYLAIFKSNKLETMAILSEDGTMYKTETEIKVTALPKAATAFLSEKCRDKKIEAATIIEDEEGVITFEAQVEKTDYRFDASGRLLAMEDVVIGSKAN